jgi:hypothetical protein
MNFSKKYAKYKSKYLNLKGGLAKIHDAEKKQIITNINNLKKYHVIEYEDYINFFTPYIDQTQDYLNNLTIDDIINLFQKRLIL